MNTGITAPDVSNAMLAFERMLQRNIRDTEAPKELQVVFNKGGHKTTFTLKVETE